MKRWISVLIWLGLVMASYSAEACPVCFSAKEGTRGAFLGTTIFLTSLPWLMVSGFVVWYRRRSRDHDKR